MSFLPTVAGLSLSQNWGPKVMFQQLITFFNLPGKVYARVLEWRILPLLELQIQEE